MINILFAGNSKVFDGLLLCLMSITKHTREALNVYILTADVTELSKDFCPITQQQKEVLEKVIKQTNFNSKITLIKLGKHFNHWVTKSKNKNNFYTPFAFLRLFADTLNLPNKIIYLDTDIMLNGDIKQLFDINITNYELAAILDKNGHIFIKPKYFNSGVLLLNLHKIKQTNLLQKVREICLTKKMGFPDQSALNKYAKQVLYLPYKFNEQGKLKNDTIIQHFCKRIKWLPFFHTQNIKPWQIEQVHKKYKITEYDDIYQKYLKIKNSSTF